MVLVWKCSASRQSRMIPVQCGSVSFVNLQKTTRAVCGSCVRVCSVCTNGEEESEISPKEETG